MVYFDVFSMCGDDDLQSLSSSWSISAAFLLAVTVLVVPSNMVLMLFVIVGTRT
jgi:hypothetical protein